MNADLVVIGGGWAGCSAAWQASRRGLKVRLLEAARQLGGRASSFRDTASGETLDNGQHLFLGAYRDTLRLLDELGTAGFVEFDRPIRIPYLMADGRVEELRGSGLPGPLDLGGGLARFGALQPRDRVQLLRLGLRSWPALASAALGWIPAAAAGLSVADWLQACGQGAPIRSLLWEPMVLAALNARPEEARLSEFLAVLGQGFLRGGRSAALGRARAPLSQLLAPLPALLRLQGSDAELGALALGARPLPGGGWRVLRQGGASLDSRRLVVALPARGAARLLGTELAASLGLEREARRPASAIVSLWLWSESPLLPRPLQAFGPQGGAQPRFHWGFSEARAGGWRTCVVASAAGELARFDSQALLASLAGFLAGRGRPYTWNRARVVREHAATVRFEPGSQTRLAQATTLPGLALAGDWTETGLPATIEGAVRSGRLAFESFSFDER